MRLAVFCSFVAPASIHGNIESTFALPDAGLLPSPWRDKKPREAKSQSVSRAVASAKDNLSIS